MFALAKSECLFHRAQNLFEKNDYVNALKLYDKAIVVTPHYGRLFLNKAIVLSEVGDFEGAFDSLNNAIKLEPLNHANYLYQGIFYYDIKNFSNAENSFLKSAELSPGNSLLKCYLSLTHLKIGKNVKEAFDTLSSELQNTNIDFRTRYLLHCESHFINNPTREESSIIVTILKQTEYKPPKSIRKNDSFINNMDKFFSNFLHPFDRAYRTALLHQINAKNSIESGDYEVAISEYKKAISFKPLFGDIFLEFFQLCIFRNDLRSAFEQFQILNDYKVVTNILSRSSTTSLDTLKKEIINNLSLIGLLGIYYYHIAKYKIAIDHFAVIEKYFPKDWIFPYYMGLSKLRLNNEKASFKYFKTALKDISMQIDKIRSQALTEAFSSDRN